MIAKKLKTYEELIREIKDHLPDEACEALDQFLAQLDVFEDAVKNATKETAEKLAVNAIGLGFITLHYHKLVSKPVGVNDTENQPDLVAYAKEAVEFGDKAVPHLLNALGYQCETDPASGDT